MATDVESSAMASACAAQAPRHRLGFAIVASAEGLDDVDLAIDPHASCVIFGSGASLRAGLLLAVEGVEVLIPVR
jgi:hypothetical protein